MAVQKAARSAKLFTRAQQVMHPWSDRGPADLTTMVLEAVAERLDHLAYQQERAVAEGRYALVCLDRGGACRRHHGRR